MPPVFSGVGLEVTGAGFDQTKDESGWVRTDGTQMGELEYTIRIALTAYPRSLAVGKRYPRVRRPFLIFGALTWATAGLLVWAKPLQGLLIYLLPMVVTIFYTSWVTYDHHAGLRTEKPLEGSYNILNAWFNRLSGNLGYHTAHHYRQGVHWSRLPALHDRIKDGIPEHCYTESIFDAFLPNAQPAGGPQVAVATPPATLGRTVSDSGTS